MHTNYDFKFAANLHLLWRPQIVRARRRADRVDPPDGCLRARLRVADGRLRRLGTAAELGLAVEVEGRRGRGGEEQREDHLFLG